MTNNRIKTEDGHVLHRYVWYGRGWLMPLTWLKCMGEAETPGGRLPLAIPCGPGEEPCALYAQPAVPPGTVVWALARGRLTVDVGLPPPGGTPEDIASLEKCLSLDVGTQEHREDTKWAQTPFGVGLYGPPAEDSEQ